MERFEFQVDESFHRRRLDEFLFNKFTRYSKAYLRGAVKNELCQVNGYVANSGIELRENDFIEIFVEPQKAKSMEPQKIPLSIVYEDEFVMVVDKQHGILVHPTHYERDGTLLNGLTFYLNRNRNADVDFIRPHLVHRLDRETSGLLTVAKTVRASSGLCRQIKQQRFKKKYLALVEGNFESMNGNIDAPIGRDPDLKRHLVTISGKDSLSRFKVLRTGTGRTVLALEPVTGRTNQLRIHCAHIGHPIIGDSVFGEAGSGRLCLHASKLDFQHPITGEMMSIVSPEPDFLDTDL